MISILAINGGASQVDYERPPVNYRPYMSTGLQNLDHKKKNNILLKLFEQIRAFKTVAC